MTWTLTTLKLQRNFNRDSSIFLQWNSSEYAACKAAATLFRPQCIEDNKILVEGVMSLSQLGWVFPQFHHSASISLWRHYYNRIHHTEHTTGLIVSWIKIILSHTWVRYPGFLGHVVKCPILTTVVPGFPAIWLAVPFRANGAHLGICTLSGNNFFVCEISCFWVK